MSAAERLSAGIGMTYGLRHLRLALRMIYYRAHFVECYGPDQISRMDAIEKTLRQNGVYYSLHEGAPLTSTTLSFIHEVDRVTDCFVDKYWNHHWSWIRRSYSKILDHMEAELRQLGMRPPDEPIPSQEGGVKWTWDPHRQSYYYWSRIDGVYKYQTGLWVRTDASTTSGPQEAAAKRAFAEAAAEARSPPPITDTG